MKFSVTKVSQGFVAPAERTPAGFLPLSFMDKTPGSTELIDSIHVFRHGRDPARVVREALSKALVHYYPMAGRFVMSDKDGLEVACAGDGVWFVEASASCTLKDVNLLQLPLMLPKDHVLPYPPLEVTAEGVILMMQVTEFTCGGFAVGLRSSHAIADGIGTAQFVQAIGDIARGCAGPRVEPIWLRDAIPNPPDLLRGPLPLLPTYRFEDCVVDVSPDRINRAKEQFLKHTGKFCSSFDVLTAKVWQSRTNAIRLEKDQASVRIGFAANARHLLYKSILGEGGGYYGNCAYPMSVSAPRERISDGSLTEVISLIREAKQSLPVKFSQWLTGDPRGDPFREPIDHGFLSFSDWSRVGFSEVDYGWGAPLHFCPLSGNNLIAACIFLRPPPPKKGVRVMARCVVREEVQCFQEQMMEFATDADY